MNFISQKSALQYIITFNVYLFVIFILVAKQF